MSQTIKNLFKNLKNFEPSAGLEAKILKAVAMENSRKVARKLMFARAGLAVSFGALGYTLFVFGKAFLESDFWGLAKLAYSDTSVIFANLGSFALSLLETLPVVEISAMLVPIFAVMLMFSWYFKFSNNNFKHA